MPQYVLSGPGQEVRITARAPGHTFEVAGTALSGRFRIEEEVLTEAKLSLLLGSLTAHDRLKDHELRRFLDIPRNDRAEAELSGSCTLRRSSSGLEGSGRFTFSLGGRSCLVPVELRGEPSAVHAKFQLRFTQLGYRPPRLLLLSVKDELEVEVRVRAEESPASSV